ncbi:hypothetical protein BGZ94_007803 [Podila epigama]|nr:hypothetical protein BGZ94_007803 [Podila epigama]
MSKKVAIVTGANTGVGYAIVQRLVEESQEPLVVILACRNKQRAQEALASLEAHFEKTKKALAKATVDNNNNNNNNSDKTQQLAKITSLKKYEGLELHIELVDVGKAKSVLDFNARIRARYETVDYLFCNAGVLPSEGIQWSKIVVDFFMRPMDLVCRSDVLIQPKQHLTEDGIGNVLACNVFGHYLMIKGLEDQLNKTEQDPGRVIWTSSMTAEKASFNLADWQGLEAKMPYESSKWVTDLVAIRLNEVWAAETKSSLSRSESLKSLDEGRGNDGVVTRRMTRSASKAALQNSSRSTSTDSTTPRFPPMSRKHIISITTQPGVVASGIGGLAAWIIIIRIGLHYLLRFCGEKNQTITGYHGALPNVHVALKENPRKTLDYHDKYGSQVSRLGKEILKVDQVVEYDCGQAEFVLDELEKLREKTVS